MANEFIIKNGLIVEQGSTTLSGSLTVTGGITGSLFGTASYASTASLSTTSSYALVAQTLLGSITSASYAATASIAVSASYALSASWAPGGGGGVTSVTGDIVDNSDPLNPVIGHSSLQQIIDTNRDLISDNNYQGTKADGGTGTDVNAFGYQANVNGIGSFINAFGHDAGGDSLGSDVNVFGTSAGQFNSGSDVNALGFRAGQLNSGANVNAFGAGAGISNIYDNVHLFGPGAQATRARQVVFSDSTNTLILDFKEISGSRAQTYQNKSGIFAFLSDFDNYVTTSSFNSLVRGTGSFIPVFNGTNSLTSSTIFQSGSFTSIRNATAPENPLAPDILYVNGEGINTYNLISAHGDLDGYIQVNVQNYSTGVSASSDVVATADNGTESTKYIDMGINSSTFNTTGYVGAANDAYMYSTGKDLFIGNASAGQNVTIFNGGLDTTTYARVFINDGGSVGINSNNITAGNPEALLVDSISGTTYNIITARANVNNYAQLNVHNISNGTAASSDIVASNDTATEILNYVDMGINSSTHTSDPTFTVGAANDTYLISAGASHYIGSSTSGDIKMFTGADFNDNKIKLRLKSSGLHQMTGSLDVSGSVTATNFTGSLFGTASYATVAQTLLGSVVSASYAATASYVNPLQQNVVITGSLNISGSTTKVGSNTLVGSNTISGSNIIRGNTTMSGSISVSGSQTFNGISEFIGNSSLTGSWLVSGSTVQVGNSTLIGNNTITGSNNILGNSILSGSITISGNTLITGSITALNVTASFGYVSASFLDITGKQSIRGYAQFYPTSDVVPVSTVGGYVYSSGSQGDLYFAQTNGSLVNTIKLRWLEGNMYSGLLNGGVIASSSSTVYTVSSGSGLIVSMNGSLSADPYPTIQYINWGIQSASIAPLSASYDQQYVAINSSGQIYAQGTPFMDGQFTTLINVGLVLHQNRSTINLVKTLPSLAYGSQQDYNIFSRAFGSLKLSGFTVAVSGSSTGSIVLGSGTSYAPGANYITDQNNTSYVTDPGTTVSKIWRYYDSSSYTEWKYDTNSGAGYPGLDPAQYNPGGLGVLDTVGTSNYSLQRVFWFPNSVSKAFVVYYGNNRYGTLDDAVLNANVENFVEAPNTAANAIYLGTFAIKGGTNTSLQNPLHFRWIPGGLFRNVGGNGGGGSVVTQTLSGLSDVSITGPTNGQPLVYNTVAGKWENKSILTGSLFGTASYAVTASYVNGNIFTNSNSAASASYSTTSSYALVAGTLLGSVVSASYAATASIATTSSYALTAQTLLEAVVSASYAATASIATTSSYATTASYVLNAVSSSYALSASWAPGGAGSSPAGNTGEIQYNNAGSFGGAANVEIVSGNLQLVSTTDPTAPSAGNLIIYSKDIAGRQLPKWIGPSGVDTPIQPNMMFNQISLIGPGGGTTVGVIGCTITSVGTISNPNIAVTNLKTQTRRFVNTSAATAAALASTRVASLECWRGNVAGQGGFFSVARFGLTTVAVGQRMFIGLDSNATAAPTNIDYLTSTTTAKIGMYATGSTAVNWNLIYNTAASIPTAVPLGASFPVDTTSLYEMVLFAKPNDTAISYRITNMSTAAVVSGSISANLPASTAPLGRVIAACNNTTLAAVAWDCSRFGLETDY